MTQTDLAVALQVGLATIVRWESDEFRPSHALERQSLKILKRLERKALKTKTGDA